MSRSFLIRSVIAVIGGGLAVLAATSFARAEEPAAVPSAETPIIRTVLAVDHPGPIRVSDRGELIAHVTTDAGEPIAEAEVELFLNGTIEDRTRTDAAGVASLRLRGDLLVGTHDLMVIYYGDPEQGYRPANAATQLEIVPATLEIVTVPPLPGVQFSLSPIVTFVSPWAAKRAPRIFVSEADGIARIDLDRPGTYRLALLPWESPDPGIRAEFTRWKDEIFLPERQVTVEPELRFEVGFQRSYLVGQTFVDLDGQPVDPARITSLTLASSIGQRLAFEDGRPRWLQGGRVTRRSMGLEEVPVRYSVESVVLDGVNVVNRSQQRFVAAENREWEVALLLYSVRFSTRDAFFGVPIGSTITLEFPNGDTRSIPLGPNAEVTVDSLPRGEYRVSVRGAGYSPSRPIALTRNQEVELEVISRLDMAVVGLVLAVFGLGTLLLGRPRLLTPLRFLRPLRLATLRTRPRRVDP